MAVNGPMPLNFESWMRDIEKRVQRQERRLGGTASATITGDGEGTRVTDSDAGGPVVLLPPSESPKIAVTPMATGFMVTATNIEPTTLIGYRVNGEIVRSTRSTAEYLAETADGAAMVLDVVYTIDVIAYNDAGSAAPSDPFVGQLDPAVDPEFVRAIVRAGFILAGTIQVGNITIRPGSPTDPGGITIPLSNGGVIDFPADGTDAYITALLHARSLWVDDNFSLYGDNNVLYGDLAAANGTVKPFTAPRALVSWGHLSAYDATYHFSLNGNYGYGLIDNGTEWVYGMAGRPAGSIHTINKTTGANTTRLAFTAEQPTGGICQLGGFYYVLVRHNPSRTWRVYKYNTGWGFQSGTSWTVPDYPGVFYGLNPQITTNGTDLFVASMGENGSGPSQLMIQRFNTTGTTLGNTTINMNTSLNYDLRGFTITNADFGAFRYVMTTEAQVFIIDTSFNRVTAQEFPSANNDNVFGIWWDGAYFRTVSQNSEVIWRYAPVVTPIARAITWSRFNNTTGAETEASPALNYTQQTRQWMRVDTDPPGYAGDPNDPNAVRIYIGNNRQPDLGTGITTAYFGASFGGPPAPLTNGFSTTSSPGRIFSKATETDLVTPQWFFDGSGLYRLGGQDVDDHGEVAITPIVTTTGTAVLWYRQKNGYVTVFGFLSVATPFAVGSTNISAAGSIPSALCPTIPVGVGARLGGFAGTANVNTDGSITVDNQTGATRSSLRFIAVYPVKP